MDFVGKYEDCMPAMYTVRILTSTRKILPTATSTVFSCPTRLISDVHVFRVITAAINT